MEQKLQDVVEGRTDYSIELVREQALQKKFTVFSTFAGGGGSSTGYKLAGGDVRGIVEFQQVGVDTYLKNYPSLGNRYFCRDIKEVEGKEVLKMIGLGEGEELDIFDGSPPCPPFSMSGSKRKGWKQTKTVYGRQQTNIEDLSFEMSRLVKEVQPKAFICENVKGMTMDFAREHFETIKNSFKDAGYKVKHKVLNANDYGVAQGRERVFIIGIRDDIIAEKQKYFGDLEIESSPDYFPSPLEFRPTLRHAISHLSGCERNRKEHNTIMGEIKKQKRWKYLSSMKINLEEEKYVELGAQVYKMTSEEWEALSDEEKEQNPKFAWENRETGDKVFQEKKPTEGRWKNISFVKASGFQVRRVNWDRPSHTLTERGLQVGTSAHLHPGEHRGFTSWEARRIMSLPGDYHLEGTLNERLARVGLMVAPLQMYWLAKHIAENFLGVKYEQ